MAGSYDAVLEQARRDPAKARAAIALFARGTGMESFLKKWTDLFPGVPMAGGAAARAGGQERGELLPAAEDVAVLMITQGAWRAETSNIHDATEMIVEFQAQGPRTITRIRPLPEDNWESASAFFHAQQTANGRTTVDCESVTLCDERGRNLHVSTAGDWLNCGANLPTENRLMLRVVSRDEAARRLGEFCSKPNTLVFGCAGLRGLVDAPLAPAEGTLAGFMFGELVTLDGRPQFGNLMAVRLERER